MAAVPGEEGRRFRVPEAPFNLRQSEQRAETLGCAGGALEEVVLRWTARGATEKRTGAGVISSTCLQGHLDCSPLFTKAPLGIGLLMTRWIDT